MRHLGYQKIQTTQQDILIAQEHDILSSAPQKLDGKFGTVAQSGVFLNFI